MMRLLRPWMIMFLATLILVGCARVYKRQAQFSPEEYAPFGMEGTSRVCGQVFLTMDEGKIHVGAHDNVLLAPVTSYTEEAFKVKVVRRRPIEPQDPQAKQFEKTTVTDEQGHFCFLDVPAGEYFVVADITHPDSTTDKRVGKWVHARATVKDADSVHLMVTR